ncbi:7417_t:CDS:2, partial [Gigaspora rosea]
QHELQDITSTSINSISDNESGYQGDKSSFNTFLKDVQVDYESDILQLCMTLNKFAERYKAAKSLSTQRLKNHEIDTQIIPRRKARKTSKKDH